MGIAAAFFAVLWVLELERVDTPTAPHEWIPGTAAETATLRGRHGELPISVSVKTVRKNGENICVASVVNGTTNLRVKCLNVRPFVRDVPADFEGVYCPCGLGVRFSALPAATDGDVSCGWERVGGIDRKKLYSYRCDWPVFPGNYPGYRATMAYTVLAGASGGVYWACHDAAFKSKCMRPLYDPVRRKMVFSVDFHANVMPGSSWRSAPVVETVYRGRWHAAAKRYRKWFDSVVRLPERRVSDAMTGQVLCILKQQNGEVVWPYDELDELGDVALAHGLDWVGLFGWTKGGHDHLYPDYDPDPAQGGEAALREGIRRLHAKGLRCYLYANGQLIEHGTTAFWNGAGKTCGIVRPDGKKYTQTWHKYSTTPPRRFDLGCLSEEAWYGRMLAVARRAQALGADGLLYDQLANSQPRACYSAGHGHAPGDMVFADDKTRFLRRIRDEIAKVDPDFVLASEGLGDTLADPLAFCHGMCPGAHPYEKCFDMVKRRFLGERASGPEIYPEFFRYTFPEFVSTCRVPSPVLARDYVNYNCIFGLRHEIEIRYSPDRRYVSTGKMPDLREYGPVLGPPDLGLMAQTDQRAAQSYLRAVCDFQRRWSKYLLRGKYRDDDGVLLSEGGFAAKRLEAADGTSAVIVWNPGDKPRTPRFVRPGRPDAASSPANAVEAVDAPVPPNALRLYVFDGGNRTRVYEAPALGIPRDGRRDAAGPINAALSRGARRIRFPEGVYRLDSPLRLPSGTKIVADADACFVSAPENRFNGVVLNSGGTNGDCDIAVTGGVWDGCAPVHPRKGWSDPGYPGRFFHFTDVDGLVLSDIVMRDSVAYHFSLSRVRNFRVENVSFEGTYRVKCQDGIHMGGGCEHGVVRGIRCVPGATFDDLLAFNADDTDKYSNNQDYRPGPIRHILVEDVVAPDCHTFCRLLSIDHEVAHVTVRNGSAGYRAHGLNLDAARYCADPFFKDADRPNGVGRVHDILIENVDLWCASTNAWVNEVVTFETNVRNFRIRDFTWAKEREAKVPRSRPRHCFRFRKMAPCRISVDGNVHELGRAGTLTLDALRYGSVEVDALPSPFACDLDGARAVLPARPSGPLLLVDDVTDDAPFAVVDGRGRALGVVIETRRERRGSGDFLDIVIRGDGVRDRALTVVYAQPLPGKDVLWLPNPETEFPLYGAERRETVDVGCGRNGVSVWPFGAVCGSSGGCALGLDPEAPAICRFAASSRLGALYAACDVALTPEKREARFRLVSFRFDGKDGFRGALAAWQTIFPEASRVRIAKHGLWMPFKKIGDVEGWRDFGFAVKEGDSDTAWDDEHGILTFHYTEPTSWWMHYRPRDGRQTVDGAKKEAERQIAANVPLARSWRDSRYVRENGETFVEIHNRLWITGALWCLSPLPLVPDGEFSVKQEKKSFAERHALDFPKGVDGEYIDSCEQPWMTPKLDFNRRNFRYAQTPLTWSPRTKKPAVSTPLAVYEYVRATAERTHARGKLMMANGTPCSVPWVVPYVDMCGAETRWLKPSGRWLPPGREELLRYRALCGGKPFAFLMNGRFTSFTDELVEKYFARATAFGFFSGFCSDEGGGKDYFLRPELYNRHRALFRRYIPLQKALSEAGWRPVRTLLEAEDPRIFLEQFGERYVTLFNFGDKPLSVVLRPLGPLVRARECLGGKEYSFPGSLTLGPEAVAILMFKR